jgi:RNA polymerase sigma factor (sigma-70 family)
MVFRSIPFARVADCRAMMPDPAVDEDAALMAAFGAGDARAFDQLYARHHRALYRFVRRSLGSTLAAQADEVFQDTWLRVVQSRGRWRADGAARFRTWLFTLAHHRVIDQWRRSGRELSRDAIEAEDGEPFEPADAPWSHWPAPAGTGAGHEERLFWRHAGQRLLDCLDQLPPQQKAVFLLHHEDGFSVDEAARMLALGFETAKSRLRYAMSKLRTCMGAYLPADAAQGSWR